MYTASTAEGDTPDFLLPVAAFFSLFSVCQIFFFFAEVQTDGANCTEVQADCDR